MNQILVTEKLYVTPEMRKKRRIYKIEFFISVLLVCLLSSYYIYAEYDRNKSEEVSQMLLSEVKPEQDNTAKQTTENEPIVILLNEEGSQENEPITTNTLKEEITVGKKTYATEAIITIPKIDISYPVLSKTSDELLEISVNKFWPKDLQPNEVGNYCIVGHNYRNGKMFGKLHKLEYGDIVTIEDLKGRKLQYQVYNMYVVEPTDTRCTSQLTGGRKELTLITCTDYGTKRLIVKCREV